MNPPKEPKDLGLKMGSKEEVLWATVLTNSKAALKQAEDAVIFQKALLVLAGRKVKEEQRKFRKV